MCTYPVQPICTFSCTSVFILIFINPQYTVLHILSHCTSYSFYYLFPFSFSPILIYIYSLVLCFIVLLLMLFLFSILLLILLLFFWHCPLSGPVLTYISLLIIPCMIVHVTNNKEPWTLLSYDVLTGLLTHTCLVSHERSDVCGLSSRSGTHVEDSLSWTRS